MDLTLLFVISSVVVVGIFDVYIIVTKGKQHSISANIIRWSYAHPSIPFLVGFLCGHLFWQMNPSDYFPLDKLGE